jgi:hypothetical protein
MPSRAVARVVEEVKSPLETIEDAARRLIEISIEAKELVEEADALKERFRDAAARAGVSPFVVTVREGTVRVTPGGRTVNLLSPETAEAVLGEDFRLFCKMVPSIAVDADQYDRILGTLPENRRIRVATFLTISPRKSSVTPTAK